MHKNGLFDNNCLISDLVQDIIRTNGGLILVLRLAQPPANKAMSRNTVKMPKKNRERNTCIL